MGRSVRLTARPTAVHVGDGPEGTRRLELERSPERIPRRKTEMRKQISAGCSACYSEDVNERDKGGPWARSDIDRAHRRTLRYYDENAETVCARYEAVDLTQTLDRIVAPLPSAARILELGSGSGRDAAYLLRRGFDVIGLDGSPQMTERAITHHPELEGRLRLHRLPEPLPFADGSFEAVVSLATLMHLDRPGIEAALSEARRVLAFEASSGTDRILAVSVPARRPDVDAAGRDNLGRRFTALSEDRWCHLICANVLHLVDSWHTSDAGGREGITWITIVAARGA